VVDFKQGRVVQNKMAFKKKKQVVNIHFQLDKSLADELRSLVKRKGNQTKYLNQAVKWWLDVTFGEAEIRRVFRRGERNE
jgi:hypothetical protein